MLFLNFCIKFKLYLGWAALQLTAGTVLLVLFGHFGLAQPSGWNYLASVVAVLLIAFALAIVILLRLMFYGFKLEKQSQEIRRRSF